MRRMKRILAIVLMAVVAVCCTACGLDMSKVKGDWTLETAGGKTVAELAESKGVDPAQTTMNATVTDDSFTINSAAGSISYKIQVKSNGFECLDDSDNIVMSVTYDSDKDTLNFKMEQPDGSGAADYVLKKGTADLTVSTDSAAEDGSDSNDEEYYEGEEEEVVEEEEAE